MTGVTPMAPLIAPRSRGWVRAAGLLGVAMATAIVQPSVLVAVPFLVLCLVLGMRPFAVFALCLVSVIVVTYGAPRDVLWYAERGWATLVAGTFAAFTLRRPEASFSTRALGAVGGAVAIAAVLMALRSGAWGAVEWAVEQRVSLGLDSALGALRSMRGGEALPPALVTAVQETVRTQMLVFPALLGLSSVGATGVAWWVYVRLASGSDRGVGPLRDFRFNDHLVWVFIVGLILLVTPWEDVVTRIGANAVVFMGALYAVRGAAVILFLSGGLSLFGYVLLVVGLIFLPPLVLTGAMVIGIGDTWLDVRRRVRSSPS